MESIAISVLNVVTFVGGYAWFALGLAYLVRFEVDNDKKAANRGIVHIIIGAIALGCAHVLF